MTGILRTRRLELQPFLVTDIHERYVSWLNDPAVMRFSEQRHRKHTRESCEDFLMTFDHDQSRIWAIVALGQHIGNVSAHRDPHNGLAEIAILLGERSQWGKGYGTEAWSAVIDWSLANGARMATAGTMGANTGMLHIFDKSGMTIDGRRKGHFLLDGEPVDLVLASKRQAGS